MYILEGGVVEPPEPLSRTTAWMFMLRGTKNQQMLAGRYWDAVAVGDASVRVNVLDACIMVSLRVHVPNN